MNCLSVPADGVFSSLVDCLCEPPGSTNNFETDPTYLIKVLTKQDPGARYSEWCGDHLVKFVRAHCEHNSRCSDVTLVV